MKRKSFTLVLFLHSFGLFLVSLLPIANGIFHVIFQKEPKSDWNRFTGFATGGLGVVTATVGVFFSRHSDSNNAFQKYRVVVLLVIREFAQFF